jgi:hypothetical protein
MWRISIHHDFDSLGGPLSPCGSHLLRLEPFTQIRSRTLCNEVSNLILSSLQGISPQTDKSNLALVKV